MKFKRTLAFAVSFCMLAGALVGCDGKAHNEDNTEKERKATGKYMEEDVDIQMQPDETLVCLLRNAEGELEAYSESEKNGAYVQYISEDGKEWKRSEASWLEQEAGGVVNITAGEDGRHYAIVTDEEKKMHLLKQTGEEMAEEIKIPELNESDSEPDAEYFYFGTDIRVMENGNVVLLGEKGAKVYDSADGKLLHTFSYSKTSTDAREPAEIRGEKLVIPDADNTGFDIWNVEKEEREAAVSYGAEVRTGKVILENNNELYFLNAEGIHHMNPGGTLVETLAEGGSMTMGSPTVHIGDFVKGTADDFYVRYFSDNGQGMVKHYYYDKTARTDYAKKLSIYSLEENATIRQAVSSFQQKFPDVEVSYKTGESDSSATKADKIRALNTELLNRNGADVLVLDDLPVDSLIEKKVLKDISEVVHPLIEDGTIQKNIAACYQQEDGKIYSMPIRYGVPVLFGNQEKIDAMKNLDTLEAWLEENPEEKLTDSTTYAGLTEFFVNLFYDELFDENGKLDEEKMKQCISCVKKTGERYNAEIEWDYKDNNGESIGEQMYISGWKAGNTDKKAVGVNASEIRSVFDMMIPFTTIRENNLPVLFRDNTFVAHGLVGINSATKNGEQAEEFIKILFCDEVQQFDLDDGLPVNMSEQVTDRWKEQGLDSQDDDAGWSLSIMGDDGDGEVADFKMPLRTEIEAFLQKTGELTKAAETDSVLLDMITEEAKTYYGGSQELDQTVAGIAAKVDTYRAE